jgi:membrane-associated phospholipid phosphatase
MESRPSKKQLINTTVLLTALVAIVTPILYHTVDLPSAIYAKNDLSKTVVKIAKQTDDFDEYIMAIFIGFALFAWFKLKDKILFRKLLLPPVASLTSGILVHILKSLFGRWRPKGYFRHEEYGFEFFAPVGKYILASYPSGHSCSIMAIMTATGLLFPKWRIPCFAFAILLGSTRVIVSAHYPSDVIAGLTLGYLTCRWLCYLLVQRNILPEETHIRL